MAINKNFSNYSKAHITVKVLSKHPPGDNHATRRRLIAEKRLKPERDRRHADRLVAFDNKLSRMEKMRMVVEKKRETKRLKAKLASRK